MGLQSYSQHDLDVQRELSSSTCACSLSYHPEQYSFVLGWPKSLFGFFCKMLQGKPERTFWPTQYNNSSDSPVPSFHCYFSSPRCLVVVGQEHWGPHGVREVGSLGLCHLLTLPCLPWFLHPFSFCLLLTLVTSITEFSSLSNLLWMEYIDTISSLTAIRLPSQDLK